MSIEFLCPSCQQQLRVPDTAAGKNAKCPKCTTILTVPGTSTGASPLAPPPQAGFDFSPPAPAQLTAPAYSQQQPEAKPTPPSNYPATTGSFAGPPPGSPFAGAPGNPFAFQGNPAPNTQSTMSPQYSPAPMITSAPNPYASPQGGYHVQQLAPPGMVGHQIVEVSPIVNHAIEVWKRNLGVLMGMTLLPVVISLPIMGLLFGAVIATAPLKEPAVTIAVIILAYFALIGMQAYLGIGQALMCIKLSRGQEVTIGELFSGVDAFLPVLGWMAITTPIMIIAALPLYIPLVFLLLMFWPSYHLIVDRKCKVMDSFNLAKRITEGNKLTTFVLVLVSYGFALLGEMACFIGLFFAIPLISLIWSTAYLMMSGQIPIPPRPQPYMPPPQPPYQPPQGYLPPPQK
jgi:hypothetical protein